MNTDSKFSLFATRLRPRHLDGVVQNSQGFMHLIQKAASCRGYTNSARVAVEKHDTKLVLQRFDPRTDARLADAKHSGSPMKA